MNRRHSTHYSFPPTPRQYALHFTPRPYNNCAGNFRDWLVLLLYRWLDMRPRISIIKSLYQLDCNQIDPAAIELGNTGQRYQKNHQVIATVVLTLPWPLQLRKWSRSEKQCDYWYDRLTAVVLLLKSLCWGCNRGIRTVRCSIWGSVNLLSVAYLTSLRSGSLSAGVQGATSSSLDSFTD